MSKREKKISTYLLKLPRKERPTSPSCSYVAFLIINNQGMCDKYICITPGTDVGRSVHDQPGLYNKFKISLNNIKTIFLKKS